jgi:serine/threonine protein kinase
MSQRYEVKGKIGHGGLGEVYLAYDTRLDREVALKRVRPADNGEASADSLAADLLREAKTLSALQHPNIVTIYDVGRDDNGPFVIMEFLKGETLDQVIDRGKLSPDDFREVVLQSMEGMVAAQALGLVHRDLKPGNLMVIQLPTGKFQIKILDFGLAKFSKLAVPQTQDQEAGIFGSIFFMAPEQFERLPLDARTDMYSLGCIYYQILAQKHPFDGRTPVDVMVSHLQHLVTPLHQLRKDIPAWMADWVMWLISREMDDRPADARTALEYFLGQKSGLPSTAPGYVPPPPPLKSASAAQVRAGRGGHTQPVRVAGPGHRVRGGTHSSAVSSRPSARRVQKTSRLHWSSVLTAIIVVGIGLYIFWRIYYDGTKPKENPRDILTSLKGDPPQGGPDAVRSLVKLAARGGEDAKDALVVLKKLQGQGVAESIAIALESAQPGPLRDLLIEAAGAQPSIKGAMVLLKIALKEKGDVKTKAMAALGSSGLPSFVPELMNEAPNFSEEEPRKEFYKTVESMLSREKDRDARVKALTPHLGRVDVAGRLAILRLLGASGSSVANNALIGEIAVGGDRRDAAIATLRSWSVPDSALADAVFDVAQSGNQDLVIGAYCGIVTRIASLNGQEVVEKLKKAIPLAKTDKSRGEFATALGSLGSPEAFAFATELANGTDDIAQAVKAVLPAVSRQKEKAATLRAGENNLDSSDAVIVGSESDATYQKDMHYLNGWRSAHTRFAWDIIVPADMTMEVEVLQSSVIKDHSIFVSIAHTTAEMDVAVTKTSDAFTSVKVGGKFKITKAGSWRVWVEPGRTTEPEALVNLRKLTLKVE